MKTVSVMVENLCVPCRAFCRYCLLSSTGGTPGVPYDKGKSFADRFLTELKRERPDLSGAFYIGCSMDTPDLTDYIRFCQDTGSPSARFLQFNGLAFRSKAETEALLARVKAEGVDTIDLTFYGLRDYHDRVAGRTGDFDFLLDIKGAAETAGIAVRASAPLTCENVGQAGELLDKLLESGAPDVNFFIPHSKGRGRTLESVRLTRTAFDALSEPVKARFVKVSYRTEGEWLARGEWPQAERRTLVLCLTPDNIGELEAKSAADIVTYLEALDDAYYGQVPPLAELAVRYGDREGEKLFRLRDLHLLWQQRWLAEHPGIYDMNDESHHFSIRV